MSSASAIPWTYDQANLSLQELKQQLLAFDNHYEIQLLPLEKVQSAQIIPRTIMKTRKPKRDYHLCVKDQFCTQTTMITGSVVVEEPSNALSTMPLSNTGVHNHHIHLYRYSHHIVQSVLTLDNTEHNSSDSHQGYRNESKIWDLLFYSQTCFTLLKFPIDIFILSGSKWRKFDW